MFRFQVIVSVRRPCQALALPSGAAGRLRDGSGSPSPRSRRVSLALVLPFSPIHPCLLQKFGGTSAPVRATPQTSLSSAMAQGRTSSEAMRCLQPGVCIPRVLSPPGSRCAQTPRPRRC